MAKMTKTKSLLSKVGEIERSFDSVKKEQERLENVAKAEFIQAMVANGVQAKRVPQCYEKISEDAKQPNAVHLFERLCMDKRIYTTAINDVAHSIKYDIPVLIQGTYFTFFIAEEK